MRKLLDPFDTAPFDLTDEQWQIIAPFMPVLQPASTGRPSASYRQVLNGILWKLRTGIPWHHLPKGYPSPQTCHRRYQLWAGSGIMYQILHALTVDLHQRSGIDIYQYYHPLTLSITNRSGLFSLLHLPGSSHTWQISTLLLLLNLGQDEENPDESTPNPAPVQQYPGSLG